MKRNQDQHSVDMQSLSETEKANIEMGRLFNEEHADEEDTLELPANIFATRNES